MAAVRRVVLTMSFKVAILLSLPCFLLSAKIQVPDKFVKPNVHNNLNNPQPQEFRNDQVNRPAEPREHPRKTGPLLVKIAKAPECASDVKQFCGTSLENNFALMDCLQNDPKDSELAPECQHFLFQYKLNLTKDMRFESVSWEVCKDDFQKLTTCQNLPVGEGERIPCLMEHHNNITGPQCKKFLIKMESVIFSDYRLVKPLLRDCQTDIEKTACGRLGGKPGGMDEMTVHSQGDVILCLEEHMGKLNKNCRFQIMRMAELQADDFHLDRPLYYACRQDREKFCAKIAAGGGRVYQCLFKHKFEAEMTDECRDKLVFRQKLIAEDYKADKTFSEACATDIKEHNCLAGGPNHEFATRSSILLCLESVLKSGQKLAGRCISELTEWRRSIMSDYQISPELVVACQVEIADHCDGLGTDGKTIHCLMRMAKESAHQANQLLTPLCTRELEALLKEADVGEDIRVDTALQDACSGAVAKYCSDIHPGDARVMGCLMEKLEPDILDSEFGECAEHLLEIQYFVSRDFRLDHKLYKNCHKEAAKFCGAPQKWVHEGNTDVDPGPLVLPCLYRHMVHKDAISKECKVEVRRVMAMRASSIDLMPEIEGECIQDLAQFCSDDTAKGVEIQCLQNNYENLQENCMDAVANFTAMEDADIQLDVILMKACMPMIKDFCAEDLENEDEEEIMECLIENKNDAKMNHKCAVGIEHHQIISLKDIKFNHKFKENCKESVARFCNKGKQKPKIVTCLSEIIRNDTLMDQKHRIEKKCRRQVKFELLQRSENIKLDPDLFDECEKDRKKFCEDIPAGKSQVLECLKKHHDDLQIKCRKILFSREEDEVVEGADYTLITACKTMIQKHCPDRKPHQLLDCLKNHRHTDEFDPRCHRTVLERMILQNQDYRLNPQLQKACKKDIPKFCSQVIEKQPSDNFLEGKLIGCLKKQFKIHMLSNECEGYIQEVIRDSALDYRQDPILAKACKKTIMALCSDALPDENNDNEANPRETGAVQECLKAKFTQIVEKDCIAQVGRILAEGKIDVHVDPLLHAACVVDIRRHCDGIPPGDGAIMSCLLSLLEDKVKMQRECNEKLKQRKDMWELAAKVAPMESFSDVAENIYISPSRNYFLAVLLTIVGVIFIMGLSCGRVTKRHRPDKHEYGK